MAIRRCSSLLPPDDCTTSLDRAVLRIGFVALVSTVAAIGFLLADAFLGGRMPALTMAMYVFAVCALVLGNLFGMYWLVRGLFYYPLADGAYRFYALDKDGGWVPAETGRRYRKSRLLAVAPVMDLSTAVRIPEEHDRPVSLNLIVRFVDEPTAEGARHVNWLNEVVQEARHDMHALYLLLQHIKRDEERLGFTFSADFQTHPHLRV